MTCTSKLQNNISNGFPILDNHTKVLSFMFRTLLVLKFHLGSLEKLVGDGYISPWSKNGACGTI